MKTSNNCINLIKQFEGFQKTIYKDAVGINTIGYGHVVKSSELHLFECTILAESQAVNILQNDLNIWETYLNKVCVQYNVTFRQNEFDALCSLFFNTGGLEHKPTMLEHFENKVISNIGNSILLYNTAGGKKLAGLVRRRQAEHDLFFTPIKED